MVFKKNKVKIAFLFFFAVFVSFFNGEMYAANPIPEGHIRIHIQREDGNYENLGVWLWEDVAVRSDQIAGWPQGSTWLEDKPQTDYGVYVDVELAKDPKKLGFLINNKAGANISKDFIVHFITPKMNQIWLRQIGDTNEVTIYEPADLSENTIRIHYFHEEEKYEPLGLWVWGDVVKSSGDRGAWPVGAIPFSDDNIGVFGAYIDLELKEDAAQVGFLVVNRETSEQTRDMGISNLENRHFFIQKDDLNVYTNPYYVSELRLEAGTLLKDKIELKFTSTAELTPQDIRAVTIRNRGGFRLFMYDINIKDEKTVELISDLFTIENAPYRINFGNDSISVIPGWQMIDELYAYDGELGAFLHNDGTAMLKLWSPVADFVSVVLYDKFNQHEIIADDIEMNLGNRGVWEITLNEENTGIKDLRGYFYHYKVESRGETKLILDPYAPSMAAWDNEPEDSLKAYDVGKAAIINPSQIGPELDFANIEGFERRTDAIIYETHIRDFTSDPSIDGELNAQFGTFKAFIDKLDYIKDLGVTHIQLLPIMSYFWGDELANYERLLEYSSRDNNYNWGYDPHSYFSVSGMYSENPNDPELRIAEFKELINEIHSRGMGVILDVVYNHTARLHIFEDIIPNYYHFMDADGTPRTSFGGGRLGTTHEMARRILVDSILYWVNEFKVDGFRFDMMGDHDAESIQISYDRAKEINPNILMIGEGWRTFAGDEIYPDVKPADQDWVAYTNSVGVFSDEIRNELKSGFGHEGQPRFITGGARNISQIFDNIIAQPHNFKADDPGDVVQYIAAHDNLTLHDVIAVSIRKDPDYHQEEIQKRIRLGNTIILTSQGKVFLHSGQEYGRTKQFRSETQTPPYKSTYTVDKDGNPFDYPFFIHDSYDSSDAINMFDWEKVTNEGIHKETMEFTKGLIELRKSTDAFRLPTMELVNSNVSLVESPDIKEVDLVIGYRVESTSGDIYYVFINADETRREIRLGKDITDSVVLVDGKKAGTFPILRPSGVKLTKESIILNPLTPTVLKIVGYEYYLIMPGDTLHGISRKTGISIEELIEINKIENPNLISVDQVLKIRKAE